MGIKKIFINILFALAVASPLALLESNYAFSRSDYPTEKVTIPAPKPVPLGLRTATPGLLDLVSNKASLTSRIPRTGRKLNDTINEIALEHGVSPALVKAVIRVESNWNPNAVSHMGAVGLMQVLPATARRVGVRNPHDPQSNIRAGVKYLRQLLDMFGDDEALALAAYNSGPANVQKYGDIPPFKETRSFVSRVMYYYRTYLNS
jgi:soluble lytic murein transglycosylase-like protein